MAVLYVVATPIGNLQDITQRALDVLSRVEYVACEDTRMTLKLLSFYHLKKKLISHYSYNEAASGRKILDALENGSEVALVSDSGTPSISDPGTYIVRSARERGFSVVPIPGPSALTALLSVSGIPAKSVTFEGFLSPKKGRRKNQLKALLERGNGFVLFESPFRITSLLEDLTALAPARRILLGREITKIHEEFLSGTGKDVLTQLQEKTKILGEFSLVIEPEKNVKEIEAE